MPDLLIHNARIRTMDASAPHADWVLIRDGCIAAIGKGMLPDAVQRIDAGGRLVLPGFQDAHIHLLSGGIDMATAAYLYDVDSVAGLVEALRAHAATHPDLPVVWGSGWQAGVF
ncbi:MAG: amidohydrolase family protein, partial [Tabrizicola sp.]